MSSAFPPAGSPIVNQLLVPTEEWARLTHYLFRYPAKFHPPVVAALLERYSEAGETVLDPFCGSGTLMVEALRLGRGAVGVDVDPVAVAVSRVKVHRYRASALQRNAERVLDQLVPSRRPPSEYEYRKFDDLTPEEYEEQLKPIAAHVPSIPNLFHWFRRYVIVDLARIREAIASTEMPETHRQFFMVVFASIIRNASNADPVPVSGLEVTRWMRERDQAGRVVDPFTLFEQALARAVAAAEDFADATTGEHGVVIRQGDITKLHSPVRRQVDLVLTSPPYHGAVDYYRRHQLEMFWLGLTITQQDRLALLDRYIGRPHVPARHEWVKAPVVTALAARWEREIRAMSPSRANEFRHYVNGMHLAIDAIARTLREGGKCLFVVGHSGWNGDEIPTTDLFAEIAHDTMTLDEVLEYPIKNRYMSYRRHNGANIDTERVLVMTRRRTV